jgi:Holliday junction resolvasome RuvABC endonuclease subunit
MALLTIDLGTTTGWCLRSGANSVSGTWSLKGDRFEGGGMRFVRFRAELDALHAKTPVKYVAYEAVHRHAGTAAAHIYGGLMATLTAWCETHGIPYEGVGVGTIKKHVTGNGAASKAAMIAAARKYGFDPSDDNEADAIALMLLKLDDPKTEPFL